MTAITTRPVSIKLDEDLRERIRGLAATRKRTMHWMMREAISQYIEREEKREAFRLATLTAWREYQETSLHVTEDEADDWLAGLTEGQDVEPPQCHR
ncbi:MAG: ribbon-helix-helix protein, CopG family [Zoogloeaceae bacterium]|jgi:predicted transcriptional regulator|nr:ribbon-helix-helix protein, CopG family [Zoogloeaceae bacterium]